MSAKSPRYRIGIDIGGTFTDIIVFDKEMGEIARYIKVSSTPRKPENAVINSLKKLYEEGFKDVEMLIHATTVATNALLGQIGLELPRTALITTQGFRDIIEIGRQRRAELYNLFVTRPRVLVPRRFRFEVRERINYLGEIIEPLNDRDVERVINKIVENRIESVAVSLLHSYANPIHEIKILERLREKIPNIHVSISSEVDPEHREYERTSTTVVNAVLMPIVSRYLKSLEREISQIIDVPLYIMQSSGGIASTKEVTRLPVSIIESGPASGVMAAIFLAEHLGITDVMSFDMGGTTAKAGTILNGVPLVTTEYEVGGKIHAGRIIKGSGYPVRYPFIDLAEISAGGGTIVWVDKGGALRVGPISAGAEPGPACYGLGGENPTITDANLLLGRLNQKYLLGGQMKIHIDLSKRAFKDRITKEIGIDPVEAAIGAIKIANSLMSKIMRIVSVERGIDPRDLSLIAFGGAGPMHACALAEELEFDKIVIPRVPGLFSALGLLAVDFKHTFLKSIRRNVDEIAPEILETEFKKLEAMGMSTLKEEGIPEEKIVFRRYADMRYWGQGYELLVPCEVINDEQDIRRLVERFHKAHEGKYGYSMPDEAVEIINLRVEAIGIMEKPRFRKIKKKAMKLDDALLEKRLVYFEYENDFIETPVFIREKLAAGINIEGPAIIEQYDTTTVIYSGWRAFIDDYGNIILQKI